MGDTREDTSENGVVLNQKSKFSREKKKEERRTDVNYNYL